ncbi:dimethylhistidine N-methyltransferase [Fictibacillus phosphorivorans]|uniref:Dimethylhistidine N-methyltransferase n=1 Tax=Fictibacillus phosphorivorans TaxID=1221500 RepID=A0A163SEL7_9BACL|nr:L-histidine N(alpha)-methyltransferase [Fictibacillus phosphorivorans]KZE68892.1 dimethylhistidine N-methyltransferase [Fictibacillus phosphorivorans]
MKTIKSNVHYHVGNEPETDMYSEVLNGLRSEHKTISPKYFYDKKGSELFEAITMLAEYYPTRTELFILNKYRDEMASAIGTDTALVEFGSGSSEKVRTLLEAMPDLKEYVPIDISKDFLYQSARALSIEYPHLHVHAVSADYTEKFELPKLTSSRKAVFFPGSTIGNFEPHERVNFLKMTADFLKPNGGLLIGVDMKKDHAVLNAAYNDSKGITSQFNTNLLNRLNRELLADFNLEHFHHHAFYHAEKGRIEMHLVSLKNQTITIGSEHVTFAEGETIQTENSYKFTIEEFQDIARDCGFTPKKVWVDEKNWFSMHYLMVE